MTPKKYSSPLPQKKRKRKKRKIKLESHKASRFNYQFTENIKENGNTLNDAMEMELPKSRM